MHGMGTTSRQRHASRQHKSESRWRPGAAPRPPELIARCVAEGAARAFGTGSDTRSLERLIIAIGELDADHEGAASAHFSEQLVQLLSALWERGWQPLDVAHVARRQWTNRVGRLAAAAIGRQAKLSDAPAKAPAEWLQQLSAVQAPAVAGPAVLSSWRHGEGLTVQDAWRDALRLLGYLQCLPPVQQLCPPPSQWGRRSGPQVRSSSTVDPKLLSKIRGLLAKAESTEFPDEADALTSKAQDLMTRHAIDVAVLDAEHGVSLNQQVRARRIHIENPYPEAKVQLLDAVGSANDVKVVWTDALGLVTAVGMPADTDLVELLYTSLLVQATRSMAAAADGRSRVKSFRRAFLLSYATRIRERLAQSQAHASEQAADTYGTALVPLMRERAEAVQEVFSELFPETRTKRSSPVDVHGWRAGRAAADEADLGCGGARPARRH